MTARIDDARAAQLAKHITEARLCYAKGAYIKGGLFHTIADAYEDALADCADYRARIEELEKRCELADRHFIAQCERTAAAERRKAEVENDWAQYVALTWTPSPTDAPASDTRINEDFLRLRFFRDLAEGQRLAIFKELGAIPADYEDRLQHATELSMFNTLIRTGNAQAIERKLSAPASDTRALAVEIERRGIYIASKTKHASRWRQARDENGVPIISTWIDEAGEGETGDFADLWHRCITESATASALVLYREPDDVLKGGWIELGAALAHGVPVFAVGIEEYTVANAAGIMHFGDIGAAFVAAALSADRKAIPPAPDTDRKLARAVEALYRLKTECDIEGLRTRAGFDCWLALADEALSDITTVPKLTRLDFDAIFDAYRREQS